MRVSWSQRRAAIGWLPEFFPSRVGVMARNLPVGLARLLPGLLFDQVAVKAIKAPS